MRWSPMLQNLVVLFCTVGVSGTVFAAEESYQSFNFEGKLVFSGTPVEANPVTFTIKILDPSKNCVLYEEQQAIDMTSSGGLFNVVVGSPTGAAKRSGDDPNFSMAQIFQNTDSMNPTNTGCPGSVYNPNAGDQRFMRVHVDDGTNNETLTDMTIGGAPSAVVAESVQDLDRSKLLEIGSAAHANATQSNFMSMINGSDVGSLHNHDGAYATLNNSGSITMGANQTLELGEVAGTPGGLVASDAGKMWIDISDSNKVKFWDGTNVIDLTAGSGAITSVFGRTTAAITAATSDYDAVQVDNTASGNISATNVQAAINELDSEKLALAGDTMGGSLNMGTNTITNVVNPTNAQDAATKDYVDSAITTNNGSYVAIAGDTMTGTLTMEGTDGAPVISGFRKNTTPGTEVLLGNTLLSLEAAGNDGSPTTSRASISMKASQNWTTGANGTQIEFRTTANGSNTLPTQSQMVIDNAGKVGIGTSSPHSSSRVHIEGPGDQTIRVESKITEGRASLHLIGEDGADWELGTENVSTDGNFGIFDGSGAEFRFVIKNTNGNIGIGNTNPSTKLDVHGRITADVKGTSSGDGGSIVFEELNSNGQNFVGFRAPDALDGDVVWELPAADGTNNQVLKTNGSGVLSWITPGDVSSSTTLTAGTGLTGGGDLSAGRTFDVVGGDGIVANANDIAVDFTADKGLHFVSNKLEVEAGTGITLDASGVNVDVGTTANKIVQLDGSAELPAVNGSNLTGITASQVGALASISEDGSPSLGGNLDMNGKNIKTANGFNIDITGSASGNDFTVDTNKLVVEGDTGNVGIGTTGPSTNLEVRNLVSGRVEIKVRNDDSSSSAKSQFTAQNNSSDKLEIGVESTTEGGDSYIKATNALSFKTAGVERITVAADGKVGIGISTPLTDLEFDNNSNKKISISTPIGDDAGKNLTLQAGAAGSGASSKNGGDLKLKSGQSQTNGKSKIRFTAWDGASSVETMVVDSDGVDVIGDLSLEKDGLPGQATIGPPEQVVGTSGITKFSIDFKTGDYIAINGEVRRIVQISDDENLLVYPGFSTSSGPHSYSKSMLSVDDNDHRVVTNLYVEPWREVKTTGPITYGTGWEDPENPTTTDAIIAFYKGPDRRIYLRGLTKTLGSSSCIFQLPSGYTPKRRKSFAIATSGGIRALNVYEASHGSLPGCVLLNPPPTAETLEVSLDGISFRID